MLYLLMPGTRCSLREALLCPGCQQQKRNRQRGGGGPGDAPKINANLYRGKLFNLFFTLFLYALLCFSFRFVSCFLSFVADDNNLQRNVNVPFRRTRLPSGDCPAFAAHALCPQLATGKHFVFRLHNLAIFVP